jgi:hypothetical protein
MRCQQNFDAIAGEDFCGVPGKDGRVLPCVIADNDSQGLCGRVLPPQQERSKTRGGLTNDHPIHGRWARAKRSADASCAKAQASAELLLEQRLRLLVTRLCALNQHGKLTSGLWIRVLL